MVRIVANEQVAIAVIAFVSVYVMHHFTGGETPAESRFRYSDMLRSGLSVFPCEYVSLIANKSSAVPLAVVLAAMMRVIALLRTVGLIGFLVSPMVPRNHALAVNTIVGKFTQRLMAESGYRHAVFRAVRIAISRIGALVFKLLSAIRTVKNTRH